jgi:hypothetical protein
MKRCERCGHETEIILDIDYGMCESIACLECGFCVGYQDNPECRRCSELRESE